jgi:exosortase/archaeosortase family protein
VIEEHEGWTSAKGPALRFVLIAALLMLAFYAVFYTSPEESPGLHAAIERYLALYARAAGWVLSLVGFDVRIEASRILVEGNPVEVVRGCDAMEPIALFVAAVLAFQVPWGKKLLGLFVGVPVLALLNLVRIILLSLVDLKYPARFEAAHLTVGQTVFIVCTLCLWFAWVIWATREESASDAAAQG